MSPPDPTPFAFSARASLPEAAAGSLWSRWCALSSWADWDLSLSGVLHVQERLFLGQRFAVVPKATGRPIPVCVASFEAGRSFTTASAGPLGLLAFGHALLESPEPGRVTLEHSVCAVVADEEAFAAQHWRRLRGDVEDSVAALAALVDPAGGARAAARELAS